MPQRRRKASVFSPLSSTARCFFRTGNPPKCSFIRYAHERGMKIIAEGLESASEVDCVLRLGVDLLQGYYLARPAAVPSRINQPALDLIREFRHSGVR